MKVVEKITTIFWDWLLIYLKKQNKNLVVTKRLSAYVDTLSELGMEGVMGEYREIHKLPNGSYQTPISQIRNLQLLIKLAKSKNILEVGTFRGFTSMCMAMACADGKVTTCEINGDNAIAARNLWAKYGLEDRIELVEGDAEITMNTFAKKGKTFDFIYVDADKSKYDKYLELADKLCSREGLIVIDNSLWAGLVAYPESKYSHARLINLLNQKIFKNKKYTNSVIPAWDGVIIIYKQK